MINKLIKTFKLTNDIESLKKTTIRLKKEIDLLCVDFNKEITLASLRLNISKMIQDGFNKKDLIIVINREEQDHLIQIYQSICRAANITDFDGIPIEVKNTSRHYIGVKNEEDRSI